MRARALLLCIAALAAAGCGENEKERYVDEYKPLNDRLIAVSQQISASLAGSEGNETVGVRLDLQIAQLETVNRNIENLDTPEELRDESSALTRRIRDSVATLKEISTAIQDGKPEKASSATVELASRAQAVNAAQKNLSRATGAKVR
jgi:hypothetical protein